MLTVRLFVCSLSHKPHTYKGFNTFFVILYLIFKLDLYIYTYIYTQFIYNMYTYIIVYIIHTNICIYAYIIYLYKHIWLNTLINTKEATGWQC